VGIEGIESHSEDCFPQGITSLSDSQHLGEWVFVLAAAGGVTVAIQIAKALGARVIAAALPNEFEMVRVADDADVVQ